MIILVFILTLSIGVFVGLFTAYIIHLLMHPEFELEMDFEEEEENTNN